MTTINNAEEYSPDRIYKKGDIVHYKNAYYISLWNVNCNHSPGVYNGSPWAITSIKEKEKEKKQKVFKGNITCDLIKGENIVVYGNITGNIFAEGKKSVVVIFGDIVGDVKADQVVRVYNVDKYKIKVPSNVSEI